MELDFVCGAANTVGGTGCVQWLRDFRGDGLETVAYPLHNLVAITHLESGGSSSNGGERSPTVVATLRGHTGRINALASCPMRGEIYSCSEDATVCVWVCDAAACWTLREQLLGLSAAAVSIACLTTLRGGRACCLLAASDAAGTVCLWRRCPSSASFAASAASADSSAEPYSLAQSVRLPAAQTPHALHFLDLAVLSASDPIATTGDGNDDGADVPGVLLAMGCVDSRIHLHHCPLPLSPSTPFVSVGALAGHDEWATCLASVAHSAALLLASGSKDCKIRVWRLALEVQGGRASAPAAAAALVDLDEEEDEEEEDGAGARVLTDSEGPRGEARLGEERWDAPLCLLSSLSIASFPSLLLFPLLCSQKLTNSY